MSTDLDRFRIKRTAVKLSKVIADLLEDKDEDDEVVISLPIKSNVLDKVVKFCKHYRTEPSKFFINISVI